MPQFNNKVEISGRNLPGGKASLATGIFGMILAAVYAVEGGYVNDPTDPGGETNHGITIAEARRSNYVGRMRDLQKHCEGDDDVCADSIYYEKYIIKPGYGPMVILSFPVAKELVDTAVNMGPPRPSRWFQRTLGVGVDGKVGPATIAGYVAYSRTLGPKVACVRMLDALDAAQKEEYLRLIRVNPKLIKYKRGWLNNRIGNVNRKECDNVQ